MCPNTLVLPITALLSVWQCLRLCIYRQGDQSEAGDANPSDNQSHAGDQSQKQEEPLQQFDRTPPAIPVDNKEEQDQEKSQLSSSVVIEVPNVQSCLELSTITGSVFRVLIQTVSGITGRCSVNTFICSRLMTLVPFLYNLYLIGIGFISNMVINMLHCSNCKRYNNYSGNVKLILNFVFQ